MRHGAPTFMTEMSTPRLAAVITGGVISRSGVRATAPGTAAPIWADKESEISLVSEDSDAMAVRHSFENAANGRTSGRKSASS